MGVCKSLLPTLRETDSSIKSFNEELKELKLEFFSPSLFSIQRKLGKGHTSSVYLATNKSTEETSVMKIMSRKDRLKQFENEVKFLSLINHDNVVKMKGAYYDKNNLYICEEYCSGGRLLDRVQEMGRFSDSSAAGIIRTILNVLKFCHERDIVHRDLKLDNIMFDKKGDDGKIIIIDWGTSTKLDHSKRYNTYVGTTHYIAPELVRKREAWEVKKSDMYAVGVIAFTLLTGYFPFNIRSRTDIKNQSRSTIYWGTFIMSPNAKDFIESLMHENTSQRFSVEQALSHPWICRK